MIPRLHDPTSTRPLYASFIDLLRAGGFTGELSTSHADRTVVATDNSIYQVPPQAVLFPRCVADPRFREVKLAPRGGGTGTNGQSLTDGLVVDVSRHLNHILEVNVSERWARVEAGVVKDQLGAAVAPHGLFFAPELSTSNRATIGGMVNTDASGQGSCLYGKTRDHVLELKTVFLGGDLWTSRPLSDSELAEVKGREGRIASLHSRADELVTHASEQVARQFPKLNRCLNSLPVRQRARSPTARFTTVR